MEPPSPPLQDTRWELIRLGDEPVVAANPGRPPHVILQSENRRLVGSGGCNHLFGEYETGGGDLTFGTVGSTKMACAEGMDTETRFLKALESVRKWKIAGRVLELYDGTGVLLAQFEARETK
jgi:heat shock protein HslJ